jgi:DNA polymerase-1
MDCEKCGLCELTNNIGISGSGEKNPDIMIVKDYPEMTISPGVKFIINTLETNGIKAKFYITSAIRCKPPYEYRVKAKEIKACRECLIEEINKINPKYVLLLGDTAYRSIFNKVGIMKARGSLYEIDKIKYFVSISPMAALKYPKMMPNLQADLLKFSRLYKGINDNLESKMKWMLVDTIAKFKICFKELLEAKVISYDIESNGINPIAQDAKIYCLGLATEKQAFVIPMDYPNNIFLRKGLKDKVIKKLKIALEGKKLIAHNGKFDNKWLRVHCNWDVKQTFDTMLASHLLNENRLHGLKPLSKTYCGASNYELPQPINPAETTLEELAKYNAYDVFYTIKLYKMFREQLLEDKRLVTIFTKLIMPASKALELVELEGAYINPTQYKETSEKLTNEIKILEIELNAIAGNAINWNSTQQVGKLLFQELKLPVLEKTPTGNPSISSENVLPRLRKYHPIIEKIEKFKEQVKLNQFIASWGKLMDSNSRIHPNFKLIGTVTGRLSCVEPNLQQVPRDVMLRSLITAPKGWILIESDYSQVELRVAAMLANERSMKMAYQTGQDIHAKTASAVMGIPIEQVSKVDRKKAKAVNFGFLYGMSAKKFREYARDKYGVDLNEEEAFEFRKRFFDLYPDLLSWHERQRRIVAKYKYVRSPIGRMRRLPEIDSPDKGVKAEAERQSINSPVQGFASDLCLYSLVRISREIPRNKFKPIGLVHDALLGLVKEEYLDEVCNQVKAIMIDSKTVEQVFNTQITVPIEVELKYGAWGSGIVWEKNKS